MATRRTNCAGKLRHPDYATALRYARGGTRPYWCKYCRFWHCGHRSLRARKRDAERLTKC